MFTFRAHRFSPLIDKKVNKNLFILNVDWSPLPEGFFCNIWSLIMSRGKNSEGFLNLHASSDFTLLLSIFSRNDTMLPMKEKSRKAELCNNKKY